MVNGGVGIEYKGKIIGIESVMMEKRVSNMREEALALALGSRGVRGSCVFFLSSSFSFCKSFQCFFWSVKGDFRMGKKERGSKIWWKKKESMEVM